MPPPSPLSIATSSLNRLIKEEASYHAEQRQQEATIAKLESEAAAAGAEKEDVEEEGNRAFTLDQQKKALAETKAVFPTLHERIASAKENLEGLVEQYTSSAQVTNDQDLEKARKLLDQASAMDLRAPAP